MRMPAILLVSSLLLVALAAKPSASPVSSSSKGPEGSGAPVPRTPHAAVAESRPLHHYQLHTSMSEKGTLKAHVQLAHLLTGRPGGKLRQRQRLQDDTQQQQQRQGAGSGSDQIFTSSSDTGVLHCTFKGSLQAVQRHAGVSTDVGAAAAGALPAGRRNLAELPQRLQEHQQATEEGAAAAAGSGADVDTASLHVFVRVVIGNRTGYVHAFALLESSFDHGHKVHLNQHPAAKTWKPQIVVRCPGTGFMQQLHLRTDTMYAQFDVFTLDAKLRSNTSVTAHRQYEAQRRKHGAAALPRLPGMARWQVEDLEMHMEGWGGSCRLAPAVTLLEVEPPDELEAALELLGVEQRQRVKEQVLGSRPTSQGPLKPEGPEGPQGSSDDSSVHGDSSAGPSGADSVRGPSASSASQGAAAHEARALRLRRTSEDVPKEPASPGPALSLGAVVGPRRSMTTATSSRGGMHTAPTRAVGTEGQAGTLEGAPGPTEGSSTSASRPSPGRPAASDHSIPATMLISPFFGISTQHFAALLLHHMRWHLRYGVGRYLVYVYSRQQLQELGASPGLRLLLEARQLQLVLWEELPTRPSQPYLHQVLIYNHALLSLWTEDVWLLVADLDEFLMSPQPLSLTQLLSSCSQEQYMAQMYVSRSPAFCLGCDAAATAAAGGGGLNSNSSCEGDAALGPATSLDQAQARLSCSLQASIVAAAAAESPAGEVSPEAQLWLLPLDASASLLPTHGPPVAQPHPLLLYSFAVHQHNLSHHGKSIVRPPFMRTFRVHYGIPLPAPKHQPRSRSCPLSQALWAHAIGQTHPRKFVPDGSERAVQPGQLTTLDVKQAPAWYWPSLS